MPRTMQGNRRGLTALELLVAFVVIVGLFYVLTLIIDIINHANPVLPAKWEQLNLTSEQLGKISDLQKQNDDQIQAVRNENNRQAQSRNQRIKELKAQMDEIKKEPSQQMSDLRHDLSELEADLNDKTKPFKERVTEQNSKAMQQLADIDLQVKDLEAKMAAELQSVLTEEQRNSLKAGGKKIDGNPGKDK